MTDYGFPTHMMASCINSHTPKTMDGGIFCFWLMALA